MMQKNPKATLIFIIIAIVFIGISLLGAADTTATGYSEPPPQVIGVINYD